MDLYHAYAFIGGSVIGRFGGIIPSTILSGVFLYLADRAIFYQVKDTIINAAPNLANINVTENLLMIMEGFQKK